MDPVAAQSQPLPMPLPLLLAHTAADDRAWHALCWRIDLRMGGIVLGAREGAVAAIRLAWWEEALTGTGAADQGRGNPIVEAWRACEPDEAARRAVGRIASAWRMLLDPAPMTAEDWAGFGAGRGTLFDLLTRGDAGGAGALWALWDVARFDPDRDRAMSACEAADVADLSGASATLAKPLRLLVAMARDDLRAARLPDARFRPAQYFRLVGRALLGG